MEQNGKNLRVVNLANYVLTFAIVLPSNMSVDVNMVLCFQLRTTVI